MLLILMLKQLTHLAERTVTLSAMIWEIRYSAGGPVSIRKLRRIRHKGTHSSLTRSEIINLLPGIVSTAATCAKSALDVLHGIGTRSETSFATDRTGNFPRPMHLHMHVKFILRVKSPIALSTLIGGADVAPTAINAVSATRVAFPFEPLIATVIRIAQKVPTIGTATTHDS